MKNMEKDVKIFIGKSFETGEDVTQDLFDSAHLLVAGATGSGKSNFLLLIIASLMKRFTSEELRLVLADPKCVEFSQFNGSSYLHCPIIMTTKDAVDGLEYLDNEMTKRYYDLQEEGVQDIVEYNKKVERKMPYIFFIADEISDFMVDSVDDANKKIEGHLIRLAQMARPVGIHVIMATSRPCAEIIPPSLDGNFPSRLAFRMATEKDSKFFLNIGGAEDVKRKGFGLFYHYDYEIPLIVKIPLVDHEEIAKLISTDLKANANHAPDIIDVLRNKK